MKILVDETGKEVFIRIYGTDGQECTRDFIEMYMLDEDSPIHIPDAKELKKYNSDAEMAIDKFEQIKMFADIIPDIQSAIDEYMLIVKDGKKASDLRQYIV